MQANINSRKVAVIGCGFVGATTAYTLMQSGLFSEMVLLDADLKKAEAAALKKSASALKATIADAL